MEQIVKGQRWISEMEPELGLGIITESGGSRVTIEFPASGVVRCYAGHKAPIQRVLFKAGDTVRIESGEHQIEEVSEKEGLYYYKGKDFAICETEIAGSAALHLPEQRLVKGDIDHLDEYDLRYRTLLFKHKIDRSGVRGFIGGRIDLILHQLYIANEVCSRHLARVLLADEVGLGKTIEACLIIHRLLLTGRIGRVLIIVPSSLIYQWFSELLHKFNLPFRIFDDTYYKTIRKTRYTDNPFSEAQLALCSLEFIKNDKKRQQELLKAGWDMLVIDEAHHIKEDTDDYELVKKISDISGRLLLLTATPEQLGQRSHFARLKLLDHDRYYDFDKFCREESEYKTIADIADKLLTMKKLTDEDKTVLKGLFPEDSADIDLLEGDNLFSALFVEKLIDIYGPGRVMFRNTRHVIPGFPRKKANCIALEGSDLLIKEWRNEFQSDLEKSGGRNIHEADPRIIWLTEFLQEIKDEKVLLICTSKEKASFIHDTLKKKYGARTTVFHENLSIEERDKNAYWFASEEGAQLLVCSEIGSEGRNFQFAHHLVFFDLPTSPELLEQRIGRLDRVGQKEEIYIHVPYCKNSPYEIVARWYHEALDAFEQTLQGGNTIYEAFSERLIKMALKNGPDINSRDVASFFEDSKGFKEEIEKKLRQGRDRLLEHHSFNKKNAQLIADAVKEADYDDQLEVFMEEVFHKAGITTKEIDFHTYNLSEGNLKTEIFSDLLASGKAVTYDREMAVKRSRTLHLTYDHPILTRAIDFVLGGTAGNASCVMFYGEEEAVYLEAIYILECIAPRGLYAERFLPQTPVRVVVNHTLDDCTDDLSYDFIKDECEFYQNPAIFENAYLTDELIPAMTRESYETAEKKAEQIRTKCLGTMTKELKAELKRLLDLKKLNPDIRDEEIKAAEEEIETLTGTLQEARLRLDGVRLLISKANK